MTTLIDISEYPSISIIVPAYNEERCIRGRIENLLGLEYPKDKLEIIVVDDGSTDKTYVSAKQYPIRVIKVEHSGPAKAKNVGLEYATGELVSFQDANDLTLDKGYLKKVAYAYLNAKKKASVITISTKSYPMRKSFLTQAIFLREHPYDAYWDFRRRTIAREYIDMSVFQRDFYLRIGGYDPRLGAFEDRWRYKTKERPKIVKSDYETYKAEGGAITSLSKYIGRHLWRGRAAFGLWILSRRRFIKVTIYALYFGSLIFVLITVLLQFLALIFAALLWIPFLIYTVTRMLRLLVRIKRFSLVVLVPPLDFLHGISIFFGFTQGIISKVFGQYTPYK